MEGELMEVRLLHSWRGEWLSEKTQALHEVSSGLS